MKPNTHPAYKKVDVHFPKGDELEMYSTCGQDKLILDVDFRNHPAWTKKGVSGAGANSAKVNKFNKKFGDLNFSMTAAPKPVAESAAQVVPADATPSSAVPATE